MIRCIVLCGSLAVSWLYCNEAEAARSFTVTQMSPSAPAEITMGVASAMTFSINNTSNAGETITRLQFNVSGTYTLFPAQTITVSGWTCALANASGVNYQRVDCSANTIGDRIAPNSLKVFPFVIINNSAMTTDRTTSLSSVVASFWNGKNTRTTTLNNQGSWTWKSLLMTLTVAPANVVSNCTFTLTMTITNRSAANGLVVSSIPAARPTANTTGVNVNNPTASPANLTLNAGATGSIVWVYTLNDTGPFGGSVTFTACASTGANCNTVSGTSRTSVSMTSTPVSIIAGIGCGLNAVISVTPDCLYSGDNATIQMVVTNSTGTTVSNLRPSALPTPGVNDTAVFGAFTPPNPISYLTVTTLPVTFTWIASVVGGVTTTYSVTNSAIANGPIASPTTTSNIQDVDGYIVTFGAVNADSTNAEIKWSVNNLACANINSVTISVPGGVGWTFANDAYALVTNTTGTVVDTWNAVGTSFSSPSAGDRIPPTPSSGDFFLLFSTTPVTAGTYTFDVTITDDALPAPVVKVVPTAVIVNDFNTGGLNAAGSGVWREDIK